MAIYIPGEEWTCIPCGWDRNTNWFCWKCGRPKDVATDQTRWDKFFLDAEIVEKEETRDDTTSDTRPS